MTTAPPLFLTAEERHTLTGTKLKRRQIDWLRRNGFRFWVNILGEPVVPASAVTGVAEQPSGEPEWQPNVLKIKKAA